MPRSITRNATQSLLASLGLLLVGCPEKGPPPASEPPRDPPPSASASTVPPSPPADRPPPAAPETPVETKPGLPPTEIPEDPGPEILGFTADATELSARGTTRLAVELADDTKAGAHFWWSATCGAVARNPESPHRAVFVAPAGAGTCVVSVEVENAARTRRSEARLELTVIGVGAPGEEIVASVPTAPRRERPLEPFFFASSPPAPPAPPETPPAPDLPSPPPAVSPPAVSPPAVSPPAVSPPAALPPAALPPPPQPPPGTVGVSGSGHWVAVMEDDFKRPSSSQVGGRWTEYMLRRPGPAPMFQATNGDWVIRQETLSLWAMNERGAVEDFVTTEPFVVDGSRVEFELRINLPSAPKAAMTAFWQADPHTIRSLDPASGRVGIRWSNAGRVGLEILNEGTATPVASSPPASTVWVKHAITVQGDQMTWQIGDSPPATSTLSPPLQPGEQRRFVFGVQAHTNRWHKVDVRHFKVSRLEQ